MIKAIIEIDNQIASRYSPIEFVRKYILRNAKLINYNKQEVNYNIFNGDILIAKIKFANFRQE